MTTPIFVAGDYDVAAGQNLSFSFSASDLNPQGLDLQQTKRPLTRQWITIEGSISVSEASPPANAYVIGVKDENAPGPVAGGEAGFAASSLVEVAAGGSINVSAGPPSISYLVASAYGYYSSYGLIPFQNNGVITVANQGFGLAYGVMMTATDPSLLGSSLSGTGVVNTGTINVTGAGGAGVGLGANAFLNNSGTISVQGVSGVSVGSSNYSSATITNSGSIVAVAGATNFHGSIPSTGVNGSGLVEIHNSGVITADKAISIGGAFSTPAGTLHLDNSGTLNGGVEVFNSPPALPVATQTSEITNTGAIHGSVSFTGSDGVYDGRAGTLSGTLTLGDGDRAYLGKDGETVHTGSGTSWIMGGTGNDTLIGGDGADYFLVGGGNDVLDGGGGVDTLSFASAGAGVTVDLGVTAAQNTGFGTDTISRFEALLGSTYADHLTGDANNNIIDGGGGDDVLDGGGGVNTVSYASARSGVTVSLTLQNQSQNTVGAGSDTLSNFRNLIGSAHADHLTGDSAANVIDGGGGNDVLTGGGGADTLVYKAGDGNVTITDFSLVQGDRIDLTGAPGMHNWQQLMASAVQSGANTVISLPDGGSITLDNFYLFNLNVGDFALAPYIPQGDFMGTGHASLYWQNSVNNLTSAWLLTDAAPASGISLPAVAGWQTDEIGNFTGGAYGGDFLLRNTTTGMVDIWQDNDGAMTGHSVSSATLDWQIMGAVDFNGDGKSDILWRNEQNGYVSVWQMDGTNVSTTYNPGVVGLQWKLVGANDFYGDGKAEVLWRDPGSGEVNLWTIDGPGAGQTHGQTVAHLGAEWHVAGTGDFNGDGKADILWFDTVTGQVVVWEMNGPTVLAAQPIGDPGPQWRVVNVADISGDGKADILWRDTGTGQVVAWAMNGFNVDHYGVLATVDNTWKVINHHYDLA